MGKRDIVKSLQSRIEFQVMREESTEGAFSRR